LYEQALVKNLNDTLSLRREKPSSCQARGLKNMGTRINASSPQRIDNSAINNATIDHSGREEAKKRLTMINVGNHRHVPDVVFFVHDPPQLV
jgi:hypothetical protein